MPLLLRALEEPRLLGRHDLLDLLAHGLAQDVGFGQREAGQFDRDAHDLFLIDDDPLRLLEDGLEFGELVGRPLGVVLSVDELVRHAALERARPVERVQGDEVAEDLGLEVPEEILHARALELEDAVRVSRLEEGEGVLVVEGEGVDVEPTPGVLLDEDEGVVDDGQVAKAEEVHLEKADGFDVPHGILGRDIALARLIERRVLDERLGRDDDAGGVNGRVADLSLELEGDRHELGDLGVFLLELPELGDFLDGRLERRVRPDGRDELGDLVHFGQGHFENAADVADGAAGGHGPERDDLGRVGLAVLLGHVLDHFLAAAAAEIHVDVGKADPFGIQEPLEEEVVLDGIDLGDAQAIGDHAPGGRSAAGSHGQADFPGVLDEVPDDEEISGESHLLDELDFQVETVLVFLERMSVRSVALLLGDFSRPGEEALAGDLLEIVVQGFPGRGLENRQEMNVLREREIAGRGDLGRIPDGLGIFLEEFDHLGGGFEVELVAREAHPVLFADFLIGLDAEENVLRFGILAFEEVDIVGGHEREIELPGQRDDLGQDLHLGGNAVILKLEVEIPLREKRGWAAAAASARSPAPGEEDVALP